MLLRRGPLLSAAGAWFLGVAWPLAASGQVERLPPTASVAQRPTLYAVAPEDPSGPLARPLGDLDPPTVDLRLAKVFSGEEFSSHLVPCSGCSYWQVLPDGLLYKAYLAGGRESRFTSQWVSMEGNDWVWDVTLGGRVGMLRYGTDDEFYPEGWQIDVEGAAFPRLGLEEELNREMIASDFRIGVPVTVRRGRWEGKLAYYHLSSHMGDEYLALVPGIVRINYVRDCIVLGVALRPNPDLRLYAEADWAFNADGGAEPWELQFGIDYSPVGPSGILGAPFFAVNGHLREEDDFGGGLTAQTGWQWTGRNGQLFRVGLHYFNGMSNQRQFFATHEELLGVAMWYDY